MERCLACEADSGRHRSALTLRQPPVKVVVTRACRYAHQFPCALDVATNVRRRVATPAGLASEATLHELPDEQELVPTVLPLRFLCLFAAILILFYLRSSAVEVLFAFIRGPYSCAFAVVFSLSTVIGVPASPA